jgi:hypothetical protein
MLIVVHCRLSLYHSLKTHQSTQNPGMPRSANAISLRQYGYYMHHACRRNALTMAMNAHGKDAVINRLMEISAVQSNPSFKHNAEMDIEWCKNQSVGFAPATPSVSAPVPVNAPPVNAPDARTMLINSVNQANQAVNVLMDAYAKKMMSNEKFVAVSNDIFDAQKHLLKALAGLQ